LNVTHKINIFPYSSGMYLPVQLSRAKNAVIRGKLRSISIFLFAPIAAPETRLLSY